MTKKHPSKNTQFHQGVVATKQEINHYQGPVPHPDILRGFDEIVPGTAERPIKLAEDESLHRRQLELAALNANIESQKSQNTLDANQSKLVFRSDFIGQIAGFVICLICIGSSTYLGVNGHDWLAGAIAAIPTGALIKAFILNKK